MKIIFLIVSVLNVTQVFSQWIKYAELLDNNLFDIETVSDNELYVVGTDLINDITTGIIYQSFDGGTSWDTVYYQMVDSLLGRLHKVNVVNSNTVYVTNSGSRVFKSTDGGSSWNNLAIPTLESGPATDALYFVNNEIGFIGNHYGEIFKTVNGGLSWELVYYDEPFKPIYDISCPTNNICYARTSMPPKFLKSIDSGNTWNPINSAPNTYLLGGMHALNKDTIVMVSSDALILRSINGGVNWDTIPSPINTGFLDICFVDNIGYAVGRKEAIIKSIDFGVTWTIEHLDTSSYEWITAVHMTNNGSAFACSNLGSIYHLDSTNSLNEISTEKDNVNVYPNPYNNNVTIEFGQPENGIIEIYNMQGQQYRRIELKSQESITIDRSDLNLNLLFLRFTRHHSNFKVIKKLVKID